jgi:putative isomerase
MPRKSKKNQCSSPVSLRLLVSVAGSSIPLRRRIGGRAELKPKSPQYSLTLSVRRFAGLRRFVRMLMVAWTLMGSLPRLRAQPKVAGNGYTGQIHFDVRRVPFSRFGSYISISDLSDYPGTLRQSGLYLRTMHQGGSNAFELQLMRNGNAVPPVESATPTLLRLSDGDGWIEICFQGSNRLRIRGHHAALRLISEDSWLVPYANHHWEVNTNAMKYMVFPIDSDIQVSPISNGEHSSAIRLTLGPSGEENDFEAEIDAYTSGWQSLLSMGSFDEAERGERRAYAQWLATMPTVDAAYLPGAELAAYVNWESVVGPSGNLKRPAMLMSKNWMESVWSWDHAFNAMAASLSDQSLAWDQLLLPFDLQDPEGALPDKWDADTVEWQFSKPPVQGWAFEWMLRQGKFRDTRHLAQIYPLLVRWTEWYFHYRDSNHDNLPEYRHGDESGWDNSTVFANGTPIESPDLSAFLSVQMQTLAEIAAALNKPEEARQWQRKSDHVLHDLVKRFWKDGEFTAIRVTDGKPIQSRSLLLLIPIILGKRLPTEIRTSMVAELKKRAENSPFGLATEPPDSPFYESDGYWRGPIWAPSTMLIAWGLEEVGESQFSEGLKRRFCSLAQQNGMAENFDAQTGAALRDPAYTWTSSVFLVFAHDLSRKEAGRPGISE